MYSVGVGDDFFETTKDLRTLASTPVKEHTLRTKYNSLLKSSSIMMKKLKEGKIHLFIYSFIHSFIYLTTGKVVKIRSDRDSSLGPPHY